MVGGSSCTVGFEGDEPWSRPVKESGVRRSLRFVRGQSWRALRGVKGLPPLTPFQLAGQRFAWIYMKKVLDSADDVIHGTYCARLKRLARLEVPPRPPVRNACVVYVCGSIEKLSDLRENEPQQGE